MQKGVKWNYSLATGMKYLHEVKCSAIRPVIFAGQSAGAWLASLVGVLFPHAVDGIISLYGPLDIPTLWQKDEWGKVLLEICIQDLIYFRQVLQEAQYYMRFLGAIQDVTTAIIHFLREILGIELHNVTYFSYQVLEYY